MKDLYTGNQKHSCGKWKANKCKNITCSWVGNQYWCGENGSLLHCWWECKLVQPLWRTVWRFLKKTKNSTTIWFSFLGGSVKNPPAMRETGCNAGDPNLILGLERSLGEGIGNSLQFPCLGNPMERGAWWVTVYGVAESDTT